MARQLRSRIRSPPETTISIAAAIGQNPSSSSKIPYRVRKIRKLSSKTPSEKVPILDFPKSKTLPIHAIIDAGSESLQESSPPNPKTLNPLTSEGEMELALCHLRSSDPLLASLIDSYQPPEFDSDRPPFLSLAKSILFQQLATKAANSIYTKFVSLCGGESSVLPDAVASLSAQNLRQIGVSGRKASYLHDLASKYTIGTLSDSSILEMDDQALLSILTTVKGIGVWSVHMFMIFSLHRPDVLPVGDLGVRKGVKCLYGLKELPKPLEMEKLCEKWKPYSSVGSWYMWRLMEAKGIIPTMVVAEEEAAAVAGALVQ